MKLVLLAFITLLASTAVCDIPLSVYQQFMLRPAQLPSNAWTMPPYLIFSGWSDMAYFDDQTMFSYAFLSSMYSKCESTQIATYYSRITWFNNQIIYFCYNEGSLYVLEPNFNMGIVGGPIMLNGIKSQNFVPVSIGNHFTFILMDEAFSYLYVVDIDNRAQLSGTQVQGIKYEPIMNIISFNETHNVAIGYRSDYERYLYLEPNQHTTFSNVIDHFGVPMFYHDKIQVNEYSQIIYAGLNSTNQSQMNIYAYDTLRNKNYSLTGFTILKGDYKGHGNNLIFYSIAAQGYYFFTYNNGVAYSYILDEKGFTPLNNYTLYPAVQNPKRFQPYLFVNKGTNELVFQIDNKMYYINPALYPTTVLPAKEIHIATYAFASGRIALVTTEGVFTYNNMNQLVNYYPLQFWSHSRDDTVDEIIWFIGTNDNLIKYNVTSNTPTTILTNLNFNQSWLHVQFVAVSTATPTLATYRPDNYAVTLRCGNNIVISYNLSKIIPSVANYLQDILLFPDCTSQTMSVFITGCNLSVCSQVYNVSLTTKNFSYTTYNELSSKIAKVNGTAFSVITNSFWNQAPKLLIQNALNQYKTTFLNAPYQGIPITNVLSFNSGLALNYYVYQTNNGNVFASVVNSLVQYNTLVAQNDLASNVTTNVAATGKAYFHVTQDTVYSRGIYVYQFKTFEIIE